jgi:hypothetical protein
MTVDEWLAYTVPRACPKSHALSQWGLAIYIASTRERRDGRIPRLFQALSSSDPVVNEHEAGVESTSARRIEDRPRPSTECCAPARTPGPSLGPRRWRNGGRPSANGSIFVGPLLAARRAYPYLADENRAGSRLFGNDHSFQTSLQLSISPLAF